jgi:uncharacterized protein YdhG (YjbR/CyaY superfamily)
MKSNSPKNIDEYIAGFPEVIQNHLEQIRSTIKKTVPEPEETIKYGMPTFTLKGNLVHFAAYSHHIGFYPAPTRNAAFAKELSAYKTGKGSVQFPHDKPMPLGLITKIVKFNVKRLLKKQTGQA